MHCDSSYQKNFQNHRLQTDLFITPKEIEEIMKASILLSSRFGEINQCRPVK